MTNVHLCSFSGKAADIKPKDRNVNILVSVLRKHPRISTWDMSENVWLRDLIKQAMIRDLIKEVDEPYPWHRFVVTESGTNHLRKNDGHI